MDPHEPDVWARAVAGDGEAFGTVFDLHRFRVQRHLARLLDGRQDVEDAVAIVFLEAWRKRSAVRLVGDSVLPWLLVTATYTANNMRRSSRRYRALLDQLPQVVPLHEDAVDVGEPEVVLAMRRLSRADQEVLTLCVLEEWSERDAAAALRVPPGTVKSRLHRAKRRLADQFDALVPHPTEGIGHGL